MVHKTLQRAAVAFAFGIVSAASAMGADMEIETARGPAKVPANPERIVVLDVPAIDTLDLLGVKPAAIPGKIYVDYLDDIFNSAQHVGSLFEPDFEAINALAPELVVIGGRSAKQFEPLSQLAPTIDLTVSSDDYVASARKHLLDLGKLFGKSEKAQALAKAFDDKLAEAREAVKGKGNALIIMTNGPKISAYGPVGRFGWLHKALGLPQAVRNISENTHGEAVSFEFIKDADPDWLIVVDRGAAVGSNGAGAKETLNNALVRETRAWQSGQVVYLDATNIYIAGGGIQSMTRTADEIIQAFTAVK